MVGFAAAVLRGPDNPRELWINEVGVAPGHHRLGLAGRLLHALLEAGRARGCKQSWVLTGPSNEPAVRLYESVGGRGGA